uniref:Neuroepithelial cell transforming 1 n=1 Tax=Spermophilus dauricus TaxID=99837 RepID=A0A8C9P270_SPEDA
MVAHDDIGGLLPIKRTIRVLDVNNQSFREQEEIEALFEGCSKL